MDKFEKHLKRNKSAFELSAPNKDLMWDKIDKSLPVSTAPKKNTGIKILLLVLCFTVLGFLAGKFFTQKQNAPQQYAFDHSIEFFEIDQHYAKLVSYQIEQLNASPELDELEKKEFLVYINQLDKEQEYLKEELTIDIDNEEVLEAIIENFQQQINLIDELLDRVDRTKFITYDSGISL